MTVYTLGLNTGDTGGCEDVSLIKASPNSNLGSSVYFQVGVTTVGTDLYRGVIKFTGMPTGSGGSVTGASLRLTCADSASTVGVSVRGLLSAFVEAEATWNDRNATPTAWNVAGALTGTDVSGTVSGTGTIPASGGGNFTISGAGMNALVLSMIEGTNNGMLVYCTDESTANYNNLMRSSQGTDGERPQLTFDYTAGGGAPTVSTVSSNNANEGVSIVHTVTLSAAVSGSAAVYAITLAGGTATGSGTDYTSTLTNGMFSNSVTVSGGNITVPIGVSSFTVTIPTTTDALVEGAETYTLTIGGTAGTGTINDLVVFTVNSVDLGSFTGFATFTVTASATSGVDRDIVCTTSNGTASAGVDYTATTQTVTILAGNLTADFLVPIINTRKPDTDLVTTGWTVTGAADHSAALADNSDASYTTSPAITGSQGPLKTQMLPTPLAAGTHTYSFNAQEFNGDCQVRISLLNSSDVSQGDSGWISLTASLDTYSATITTTGSSTRFLVEVQ